MSRASRLPIARHRLAPLSPLAAALLLSACSLPNQPPGAATPGPMGAARPGSLQLCAELASRFQHPATRITAAEPLAADALKVAGQPVGAHCRVTGLMHERTSPVTRQ